tara:strand:+ start:6691 stop:7131 length:441 start_codon:yes stop_codon:yes gene_type:complete
MKHLKLYESFIDSDGELKDFSSTDSLYYPYNELKPYIDEFQKKYSDYTESQGWAVCNSDTEFPNTKYDVEIRRNMKEYQRVVDNEGRIIYNFNYWDIEKLDDMGILKNDLEAEKLAKKLGIIVDEYGVVQGFNDVNLVALFNDGNY